MSWLQAIVMLLGGAASAASLSESIARGTRRRQEERATRHGTVSVVDAAKELESRIGGRVVPGTTKRGEPQIVIMRRKRGMPVPAEFAGYAVVLQPKLTIHEH